MVVMNGMRHTPAVARALVVSKNLDDVWPKLREGLNTVYNGQMADMNKNRYMFLYW